MDDPATPQDPEPDSPAPAAPVVTVTGTGATPDREVEMLAGETGAALPTGQHLRSLAVPDETNTSAGGILPAVLVIGALFLLLLVAFVLLR